MPYESRESLLVHQCSFAAWITLDFKIHKSHETHQESHISPRNREEKQFALYLKKMKPILRIIMNFQVTLVP